MLEFLTSGILRAFQIPGRAIGIISSPTSSRATSQPAQRQIGERIGVSGPRGSCRVTGLGQLEDQIDCLVGGAGQLRRTALQPDLLTRRNDVHTLLADFNSRALGGVVTVNALTVHHAGLSSRRAKNEPA